MKNNNVSTEGASAFGFLPSHLENDEMLSRIGHMTRDLHESLRALGFDKMIERAAHEIPDARDRLHYVARMTEQAADRVLNATDIAGPLQDEITKSAEALEERWKQVMKVPSVKSEYNDAANETIIFIHKTLENTGATKAQLMDIMMAQDFQDLTGQVIKKITEVAHNLEQQLIQLLLDYAPSTIKKDADNHLMNGPQIAPERVANVVSNQGQVDDLLENLGF